MAAGDITCPLCSGPARPAFVTRDRNRGVSAERFAYERCTRCATLFLAEAPSDLARYYEGDYFSLPPIDVLREAAAGERYRMDILLPHASSGRLVEIGPGNGIFAIQALDAGFEVAVVEADPAAAAYLRDTLGIVVAESTSPEHVLADLPASRAIVAWHVLEHVPRPWDLLDAAAANLEPDGVLLVATPNPAAFGLRVLGGRWPHIDAPRHLFLIPHEALFERAAAAGLEPVALTHADPGGRHWNAFAWHYAMRRQGMPYPLHHAARLAGAAIAAVLAPVERRGLRGAAYTAVLRKR